MKMITDPIDLAGWGGLNGIEDRRTLRFEYDSDINDKLQAVILFEYRDEYRFHLGEDEIKQLRVLLDHHAKG